MRLRSRLLAPLSLALLLTACGGGGSNDGLLQPTQTPQPTPLPTPQPTAQGTLKLSMTDAPACGFDQVFVTVEKLRVHQSASAGESDSGWTDLTLTPARRIDLLSLSNGVTTELGQMPLAAGHYSQLRLVLAANAASGPPANSVVRAGIETALTSPSAVQSGIKLDASIDITANQMADFVLDFDACRSIVTAGASDKFLLKPLIKLMPLLLSGVRGTVEPVLALGTTRLSLQTQDGTVVKATSPDTQGRFTLAPVQPGTYNLVLTAEGRATSVLTGVAITDATVTQLNGLNALLVNNSGSGTLAGTVSTGSTPVDAEVRVMQTLSSGARIEVAGRKVDSSSGAYSYVVATGSPMVATAAANGSLSGFLADSAVAGRFSLIATAGSASKTVGPVQLEAIGSLLTNFSFP